MGTRTRWIAGLALLWAGTAAAEATTDRRLSQEDRIAELERTVAVLADELERTRTATAVPEEPELESIYGLGPAASKIYGVARGLSVGGYGESVYQHYFRDAAGQSDRWDLLRTVLYVGYKFSDRIVFNSEFEIEHATTSSTESAGGGSVSVELASLDFFVRDWANARAGLLLLPMGFINEIHEPTNFYGVLRPDVETQIIPSTWRENGAGVFGQLFGDRLQYRMYAVTGLNAAGYTSSNLRGGRQKGNRALAEDMAFTARVDWTPLDPLTVGGSVFVGDAGQDQVIAGTPLPDALTTLWEVHGQYRSHGVHLRALFAMADIGDAGALTAALRNAGNIGSAETIASRMLGGYAEIAYEVMPWLRPMSAMSLTPFYRFERYDTQYRVPSGFAADRSKDIWNHTIGLHFEPIPNVVIKTDVRLRDADAGGVADEFNLGIGFAF
jgi:hypothetical protein